MTKDKTNWLDEILLLLRLDSTVTSDQEYLVKQFDEAKSQILKHIEEVLDKEIKLLDEMLDRKGVESVGGGYPRIYTAEVYNYVRKRGYKFKELLKELI